MRVKCHFGYAIGSDVAEKPDAVACQTDILVGMENEYKRRFIARWYHLHVFR